MIKIMNTFECTSCCYLTTKKSEWLRHLKTNKHRTQTQKPSITKQIQCSCGKSYKHASSLYAHKKKCVDKSTDNVLMKQLLQQNNQLHQQLIEITKQPRVEHQTNHITNNNTNNTFNLNIFLNETCKDAMNIEDFIASIDVQIKDLVRVGEVGYVKGISDIIIHNLRKMDITKRPLHCSDYKRETVYIKDNNCWEKDTEQKERLRKVVKEISMINSRTLPQYQQQYPDCWKHDSKQNNEYDKIVIESLGGADMDIQPNQNKIMKNIVKEVCINKLIVNVLPYDALN